MQLVWKVPLRVRWLGWAVRESLCLFIDCLLFHYRHPCIISGSQSLFDAFLKEYWG